ncbi:MAG: hypothetical protein ACYTFG_07975 [Planctomycetota bacterium]|jgi:hypothetical protein
MPAPPSNLPPTSGTVRKDYVDQNRVRRTYYTVEAVDGTQKEVWSDRDEVQKLIGDAAGQKRPITVWCEDTGEIFAAQSEFPQ